MVYYVNNVWNIFTFMTVGLQYILDTKKKG